MFLLRSHCPKKPSWMFSFFKPKGWWFFQLRVLNNDSTHFASFSWPYRQSWWQWLRLWQGHSSITCTLLWTTLLWTRLHRQTPEPSAVISNYSSRNVGAAVTAASTPPLSGPWPYSARHRCSPWYDTNRVVTWCRALGKRKACPWWSRAKKERSNWQRWGNQAGNRRNPIKIGVRGNCANQGATWVPCMRREIIKSTTCDELQHCSFSGRFRQGGRSNWRHTRTSEAFLQTQ